jgi:hypothetical protein
MKTTVVCSFIHFPMAIGRYFEYALKRRNVGPYPPEGAWIPWAGGMYLPNRYAISPTIPISFDIRFAPPSSIPISFIENQLPEKPDLWLQIDAGFHLDGKPQHGKNVIVATDPHVLNYDKQRNLADTFYCMQACYALPWDEYLPYAYDPIWHAPEDQERLFDVCLLGLHYPNRNLLVDRLLQNEVKVYYDLGYCFDEARTLYNQAPIGINWSSKNDLTARVFELLGMKRLAVVNEVPDLGKFFQNGKDLITFNSVEEATEKILYYLSNEDELQALADQGHKTVKPHTWDTRISQILEGI